LMAFQATSAASSRDYRFLEQSREEAAEVAWKAINSSPATIHGQYIQGRGYTTAH
jgi:hypothetical protein